MSEFKDLFAKKAASYAQFRPRYPDALFAWLAARAPRQQLAVDVGTGNGQAAVALASYFDAVVGLDPSEGQLASAQSHPKVIYRRAPPNAIDAADASVDLVTVAQAFHWLRQDEFFGEVRRVASPGAVLAVWCYGLATITPDIDAAVFELYDTLLGRYWEPERRLVEEGYRHVAFPFTRLAVPPFAMQLRWSLDALIGYLGTWSPIPRYVADHHQDPLALVLPRLLAAWGDAGDRDVTWPLSVHAFRIKN